MFEEFKKKPEMAAVVSKIRASLESVPAEIPLNSLSKKEQIGLLVEFIQRGGDR